MIHDGQTFVSSVSEVLAQETFFDPAASYDADMYQRPGSTP
jgi:hypothetical protein